MLVVLAVFVVSVFVAGCSRTGKPVAPPTGSQVKTDLKDVNAIGDPKAPVKIVAYYPFNKDHLPAAEYVATLPKKFGGKVYAEVYNMESEAGRKKWADSGLPCAGVLTNGKLEWKVTRGGKPETIVFAKRPPGWWATEDLEAIIASQLKDPKAVPEVPVKKQAAAAASEAPAAKVGTPPVDTGK